MEKKFRWIDDRVKLDFPLPNNVKALIREIEKMDLDEDYGYFNYIEALDAVAKEMHYHGELTLQQRDLIYRRYRG